MVAAVGKKLVLACYKGRLDTDDDDDDDDARYKGGFYVIQRRHHTYNRKKNSPYPILCNANHLKTL